MTHASLKTDHELKTAVVDELAWTPSVNSDRIGVSLDTGAMTPSGQVESYPEKDIAVRAVIRVEGVTAVADEIVVKNDRAPREDADIAREAPVSITPDQAKAKTTAALVRKARFDARQVTVAITGSEIALTGTVSSLAELREAANVAWSTPGVTHVDNRLSVAP